jgi:hypothetical protein
MKASNFTEKNTSWISHTHVLESMSIPWSNEKDTI